MIHPRSVILAIATALAIGVVFDTSSTTAIAQPSDADMAAAKKAYGEGKKAYESKKYGTAVDKFKESYRLSKRPTLLYNIAISLDENKQKDLALFYYRKFLTDAPGDDAQRPGAETRVKALEAELGADAGKTDGSDGGKTDGGKTDGGKTDGGKTDGAITDGGKTDGGKTDGGKTDGGKTDGGKTDTVKTPVKIKPVGTYTAADFKHRIVEEAPPGKPLDLTAVVPEDSGFVVTLFYRGSGEAQFTPMPMKWRYNELVGRIPSGKMAGTSVQYYIDVKDTAGTVVTRIAKPASPNVIYLESSAPTQFYPDWNPDSGKAATTGNNDGGKTDGGKTGGGKTGGGTRPIDDEDPLKGDTNDDPLAIKRGGKRVANNGGGASDGGGGGGGGGGGAGGNGFMDVGSSKFKYMKWGTTAVGGALLATSIIFYVRGTNAASTLEGEANVTACADGSAPPCEFDDFLRDAESTGKSANTIHKVTLGLGVAVAGVAIYYWIKDLKGGARRETKTGAARAHKRTFIATPAIGDGVIGGAAAWEW